MTIIPSLLSLTLTLTPQPQVQPPVWHGAVLGESFSELAAAYPAAQAAGSLAARTLQLRGVTFSGVRWSRIVLAFNRAGQLDHVTFTARGLGYDDLKSRLDANLDADSTPGHGILAASAIQSDIEMRICQTDDEDVDVTFESVRYDL